MEPDKYQQAWQAHSSQTRVTVDADLLLKEAQRHQRDFRTMIAWQDYGYIVYSLLTVPLWILLGVATASPWTWYLMIPVFFWCVGYTLAFRACHRRPPNDPGEPLLSCVKDLLALVEHQIWLQRNAYWLTVLPVFVVTLAFAAHVSLLSGDWLVALIVIGFFSVVLVALFYVMHHMNKRHAALKFEPQRQELLTLLASLGDETAGDDPVTASVSPFSEMRRMTPCMSPARIAISWLVLFVFLLVLVLLILVMVGNGRADSLLGAAVDSPREPEFHDMRMGSTH